jgi:hypothetical protein
VGLLSPAPAQQPAPSQGLEICQTQLPLVGISPRAERFQLCPTSATRIDAMGGAEAAFGILISTRTQKGCRAGAPSFLCNGKRAVYVIPKETLPRGTMAAGLKVGRNWRLGCARSDLGYVSWLTDSELAPVALSGKAPGMLRSNS